MVLITILVYALWCFRWLLRCITTTEQRHRRYASDWPTWYAPIDASKISGGWRTSLEQMIAQNQRLKPNIPLAIEDARLKTSSASQASWGGSHYKSWRSCLKRNQAPPVMVEGVQVSSFMTHYPAIMPLTRASHRSPVISQEKDILSLILEMISSSNANAKGIRIGCYGIDKAEIVNALIEASKVQRVEILGDWKTMYYGASAQQKPMVRAMLEAKIDIRTYKPDKGGRNAAYHNKYMYCIEGALLTGSSNFTHNSLENYCVEAGIFTRSKETLEDYNKLFLYYQAQGAAITFDDPSGSIAAMSSKSASSGMVVSVNNDGPNTPEGRGTSASRVKGLRGSQAGVGRCMACKKQYTVTPGERDGLMMYCSSCRPAATRKVRDQSSSDDRWVECYSCATVFNLPPGEIAYDEMQCPGCKPADALVAPPPGLPDTFSCFPFVRDKRKGRKHQCQAGYAIAPSSKSASPVISPEPLGLTH